MRYGTFCSGIEAPSAAWEPLGWKASWFSEIDTFASAVLKHHYPTVPNLGDMTNPFICQEIEKHEPVDLVIAGTPCQSFSVAGQRKGLDDSRGDLTLTFLRLLGRIRPRWFIWENVPGVLSIEAGRTFGAILREMAECGYGVAYRILDAQYFGVPQRRRRVFVVGYLGDWRPAGAVLFERESLSRHSSPRRKKGSQNAGTTEGGTRINCTPNGISGTVSSKWAKGAGGPAGDERYNLVIAAPSKGVSVVQHPEGYVALREKASSLTQGCGGAQSRNSAVALVESRIRRLTPRECERLQGFPDDYTRIPYRNKPAEDCPDGSRYKSIGNSMAVPVIRWLGERIKMVDEIKG